MARHQGKKFSRVEHLLRLGFGRIFPKAAFYTGCAGGLAVVVGAGVNILSAISGDQTISQAWNQYAVQFGNSLPENFYMGAKLTGYLSLVGADTYLTFRGFKEDWSETREDSKMTYAQRKKKREREKKRVIGRKAVDAAVDQE